MSTSPTPKPLANSDFVCGCDELAHSACIREQFYREHQGKDYCVLHFPGKQKSGEFKQALQRKIEDKDFDFRGVWFPEIASFDGFDFSADADFRYATFSAKANFSNARFCAVNFDFVYFDAAANFSFATFKARAQFTSADFSAEAYFIKATFNAAVDFSSAHFRGVVHFGFGDFQAANFNGTKFSAALADFSGTSFSGATNFADADFAAVADFTSADFRAEVYFINTSFSTAVDFSFATFKHHVRFAGKESDVVFSHPSFLDLRFTRIEKPEHISFHTVNLRPSWFVNVDPRKFEFSNIKWCWASINKEITSLENRQVSSPYHMLALACRHLAINSEENHRYEEASKFRYMAMNARRLEHWRGFDFRSLSWWYWLASGYGERILRAVVVLIGILLICAVLYTQVGFARWEPKLASEADATTAKRDETGAPLKLTRALTYSVAVMTFQRPEPRPATSAAQTIVLLETIFGPVQAALLALAIRRKFMR